MDDPNQIQMVSAITQDPIQTSTTTTVQNPLDENINPIDYTNFVQTSLDYLRIHQNNIIKDYNLII